MSKKKLFLIDAYALIYRAYYAFIKNPRINSKGFDTSAIMGFLNSIFDILKREKPDYFAVAFDKGGSVDRNEIFEDYKANRDSTPEPIIDSGHSTVSIYVSEPKLPSTAFSPIQLLSSVAGPDGPIFAPA